MKVRVGIAKLTKRYTMLVTVKVAPQFYCRVWVAKQLMRLAALVLGCGFSLTCKHRGKAGVW
jgi:hypothetical protein